MSLIDNSKVLLIVNSNSALSGQVADYYAAARNLGNYRINYNFPFVSGVLTAAQAFDLITQIYSFTLAHEIDAIMLSSDTPSYYLNYAGQTCALESCVAFAIYTRQNQTISTLGQKILTDHYVSFVGSRYLDADMNQVPLSATVKMFYEETSIIPGSYKTNFTGLPCGRLGYGRSRAFMPVETFSSVKRIIDDAVRAESLAATKWQRNLPFHFIRQYNTTNAYYYNPATGSYEMWHGASQFVPDGSPNTEFARRELETRIGATNRKIFALNPTALFNNEPANSYYASHYDTNTIPAEHKDLWAFIGFHRNLYGVDNNDSSNFDSKANAYNCLLGSWSVGGASFGLSEFGLRLLLDGACAAMGTIQEPLASGVPNVRTVTTKLLDGFSFAEAYLYSNTMQGLAFWQTAVWGDPLYKPFPIVPIADGTSRTLQLFKS